MSEEVAAAIGTIEYWQNRAAQAEALEAYWREKHADAWTFIGRCDFALGQIAAAPGLGSARRHAKQMRAEIADRTKVRQP